MKLKINNANFSRNEFIYCHNFKASCCFLSIIVMLITKLVINRRDKLNKNLPVSLADNCFGLTVGLYVAEARAFELIANSNIEVETKIYT